MPAIIFLILAIACFAYYLFAALYAGFGSSFLFFWLLAAIVFFALAFAFAPWHKRPLFAAVPHMIKVIAVILIAAGCIFFCTMEGLIISGMTDTAGSDAQYVVILGAQVRGTRITKSLKKRLEAAKAYLEENPKAFAVCCGGQGSGEDISEAEAMRGWLIEQGIDSDRILMEDKSTSTYENLKFALDIIGDKDAKIAVVTNNFHVYRAKLLAGRVGFKNVEGIAGTSDNRLLLNYMVREAFALAKEIIFVR